jgi:NAD(P)-dependent dehydrogenase (short-subunit alcohol dehydrogenase family)
MTSIGRGSTTEEVVAELGCDASTLAGRTVLITGATAGIGRATALCLASLGPTVVCGCRSDEKGKALIDGLNAELPSPACVFARHLELSDLDSVRSFAAEVGSRLASGEWPPLHSLVLNAGVINLSAKFGADGMESTFRTNHLGHFLLTQLMLPYLRSAAPARVVVVASASHFGPLATAKRSLDDDGVWIEDVVYPSPETWSMSRGNAAYGSSKLANVLFASELHRREASMKTDVVACSLHPGNMMATDIGRDNWFVNALMKAGGLFGITRSMTQGAATTVLCTLADHRLLRGQYWSDCAEADASWRAKVRTVTSKFHSFPLHVIDATIIKSYFVWLQNVG